MPTASQLIAFAGLQQSPDQYRVPSSLIVLGPTAGLLQIAIARWGAPNSADFTAELQTTGVAWLEFSNPILGPAPGGAVTTPISPTLSQAWAHEETTYNSTSAPPTLVIGDSISANNIKITPKYDFAALKEQIGSASPQGEVPVLRKCAFEIDLDIKLNALGSAPHGGQLLRCALGTETLNASTSAVYTLSDSALRSFTLAKNIPGNSYFEQIFGAFITKVEGEVSDKKISALKLSGEAASWGALMGVPVTDGSTHAAGGSTVPLASGHAFKILPGVRVAFGSVNNSGAGYLVTALSTDGLTLTISPVLESGGIGASQTVTPIVPSFQNTGTPTARPHGFSLGGTSMAMISGKFMLETGITGIDNEATADTFSGLYIRDRSLEVDIDFVYRDENVSQGLGRSWINRFNSAPAAGQTQAVSLRAGQNIAANRITFAFPAVRVMVAEIPTPYGGIAQYAVKGRGRYSAAYGDECTITCD